MKIMLNGAEREVASGVTVGALIAELKLTPDFVVAELDGRIVQREEYEGTALTEGAVLELVRFVGGG